MSEYFLADQKAEERARQREQLRNEPAPAPRQEMRVSLLGDFLSPAAEPPGCDPYNNVQGKPVRDTWVHRRERR